METVAESVADYFIGHHATMPSSGKSAQAVDTACCLESTAHASMMTKCPRATGESRGEFDRLR